MSTLRTIRLGTLTRAQAIRPPGEALNISDHFGVSAVRWSDDLTEVVECKVHTIEDVHGVWLLTGGVAVPFAHLAEIAAVGDEEVWFLLDDARGKTHKYAPMKDQEGRLLAPFDNLLRALPTY